MKHIKCVLVGDKDVGKTCLLISYSMNQFPSEYVPAWIPEITHHCQETPFLLVGTQIDLRDDVKIVQELAKSRQKPITYDQGEKLAKELKAVKYVECSAKTREGLRNIFVDAILTALSYPRNKRHRKILKGCNIS